MITLYYISPTGSFKSQIVVVSDSPTIETDTFTDVQLFITASAYDTSGSALEVGDLRAYIYTGSNLIASYPMENTVVYYNKSPFPNTYYYEIGTGSTELTQSQYLANYTFVPNTLLTSSGDIFILTGSDISYAQSQSFNAGGLSLTKSTTYTVILSGSGQFYESSLIVTNTTTTSSYVTASNSPISTTISSSIFDEYSIYARTETLSGIKTTFSGSTMPVANTGSLSDWNAYLSASAAYYGLTSVSASVLINSGSTVYLLGGDMATSEGAVVFNVDTLDLWDNIIDFEIIGMPNVAHYRLGRNSLSTLPNFLPSSKVQSVDLHDNNISGSLLILSSSLSLQSINVSINSLTGNIDLTNNYNLQEFSSSYNQLSGSITSLSGCGNLRNFSCNNNHLTGSLPSLQTNYSLEYFDVSNNFLSGGLDLSGSSNLVTFIANNNQFSSSLMIIRPAVTSSALIGCSNLQVFDVGYNAITGSIPSFDDNPVITTFIARNNKIHNLAVEVYEFVLPTTLTYFDLENNNLISSSIDAIAQLFWQTFSGSAISGTLNISGSGNAPVNGSTTIGYLNNLTASGWTVYANDYPPIYV